MTRTSADILAGIAARRRTVVQGFLWTLLAVVAGTILLNGILLGARAFALPAVLPNVLFMAVTGLALWLNHHHRFRWALGLIIVLTCTAAALPLFIAGLTGNEIALFMFFIPIVLAGLLLDRAALYLTGGVILAVVLTVPALQESGRLLGAPTSSVDPWTFALQFAVVFCLVVFFLDRFGLTLQAALRSAVQHGVELQRAMEERQRADAALVDEKGFNEAIISSLPGVFYVLQRDGSFVQWNDSLGTVLGYCDAELARLRAADVVAVTAPAGRDAGAPPSGRTGTTMLEANLIAKNGRHLPYVLTSSAFSMQGAEYLVGIGIDKSELDAAQSRIRTLDQELQERLDRITALHEIDKAITGSLDLNLTLGVVLQQVTERLHIDAACILLHKAHDPSLQFAAGTGFRTTALRNTNLRLGEGLAGRAALQRKRLFTEDPIELAEAFGHAKQITEEGFLSYVAVPLIAKGHLKGVLELFHRSPLQPTDDWYAFLNTLATQAAIALDSATLFEDLERSNVELRLAYDTTIEGWARALDLRDEETVGHSRRVTDMTLALARRMGIAQDELVHIRRGALLHDIGKMGVPDSILLKPGKLTPDEWHVMRQHTVHAFDFLSPIPFLRPALDIPYCHHERWDGTGYPRGLAAEHIPLAARIFAVVDVYDALTNDRPYRRAWSVELTLEHIRAGAGSHFDPAVVEAFLAMLEESKVPTSG